MCLLRCENGKEESHRLLLLAGMPAHAYLDVISLI